MFRTSKCSSSGRFIHAVLWNFFHVFIYGSDRLINGDRLHGHLCRKLRTHQRCDGTCVIVFRTPDRRCHLLSSPVPYSALPEVPLNTFLLLSSVSLQFHSPIITSKFLQRLTPLRVQFSNTQQKTLTWQKTSRCAKSVLLKEHNYLLFCMADCNRLHVSILHAGHLQAFT